MELNKVMEWLLAADFIEVHKDKVKFTAAFYKATTGIEKGLSKEGTVIEPGLPVLRVEVPKFAVATAADFHRMNYDDWCVQLLQFINTAGVPETVQNHKGEPYRSNQATNEGVKAFRKILESGYDYEILRRSTQLYYASAVGFKKSVGHYLGEGHWRTHYDELKVATSGGEAALTNHIKTQTRSHEHNPYSIGRRR